MVTGCIDADKFLKNKSDCFHCPFSDCINDLKPTEKGLILKSEVVHNVIICYDAGMSIAQISRWYNRITATQIKNWIKNRDSVTTKLERYAPCC